ncbi:putative eukaryotic initiation factor-2B, alpha subunit [Toxoplasma gondii RUB]|uniref:Translation initiation factor eIF2B subunit alpha n=10 Tax=Toxoplasma gondii TaxID=5811 RepID=B9QHW9_TOXGV|nr:putative eukaryotic initiation factor-2B, alpha subunit [Toxoplasma gondii VEG]KFG43248.1 putative eukaryotic initiation factor-2B, alpha subunit [Toxoplasma gondii p89]KFG57869.1 putative eukaryotic initiation factor-2B, alpha subunit [Toxoplasma gondii RUB]CEL72615.1 TPA: translation initiation factor eIF-2B subunit alpha, putative [Toxoplasma gondii VEG]
MAAEVEQQNGAEGAMETGEREAVALEGERRETFRRLRESASSCGGEGEKDVEDFQPLQMQVIDAFWRCFTSEQNDLALAAVHALGTIARISRATSVFQLFVHLRAASDALEIYAGREDVLLYISQLTSIKRLTTLPLRSACLLYQQFGLRHHQRRPDISLEELRDLLVAQSAKFAARILQSKQTIADIGQIMFTKDQMVVLTHGRSSCVEKLLRDAWVKHKKRFSVIVTRHEEKPGYFVRTDVDLLMESISANGIPVSNTSVCSIGRLMAKIDMVVVGAEAVAENGGIVNRVGTSTIAMVARQHCVPFYVACEACKFTRMHVFQKDDARRCIVFDKADSDDLETLDSPKDYGEYLDYTDPELISLLFTDLGIFAPRNVSDELTTLYESS